MIINADTTDPTMAETMLGDKSDVIYFDSKLTGFGYRLRRGSKGVLRSYVVQYRVGGATRRNLIGSADKITANQAREEAERRLARVTLGQDPQGDKAKQREVDKLKVKPLIEEYLAEMRTQVRRKTKSVRRPATLVEITRYLLTGDYFRPLHSLPVASVEHKDVAACLRAIRRRSSETTEALARSKLNSFFVWCLHEGYATSNPVARTRKPEVAAERDRVLTDAELVEIWTTCGEPDLGEFGKIMRLLILLPARRSEIGGIDYRSEIDPDAGTWTLPGMRSKNHRSITYPLMPIALQIIKSVPRRMGRDRLFGERAEGFTSWVKYKSLLDARLKNVKPFRIHDLRRSVATGMADIGIEPHVIEALLNHVSGHKAGPAGIYNKSNYPLQMRAALALWENHIRALVAGGERKVLSFTAY